MGDIDLFFDEDRTYADRLRRPGTAATFVPGAGAPHRFESWARGSDLTRDFLANARRWLGDLISAP